MEMKKCKECGKLFTPKSVRSQYCDDVHYRPCPVCQKPVEAKYLSDPARCCSKECQQAMRRNASSSTKRKELEFKTAPAASKTFDVSAVDDLYDYLDEIRESYTCATYIKRAILGFVPGHEYALDIKKEIDRPYSIHAIYDFTASEKVDLWIDLASYISVNQNFTTSEVRISADGRLEVIGYGPIYDLE